MSFQVSISRSNGQTWSIWQPWSIMVVAHNFKILCVFEWLCEGFVDVIWLWWHYSYCSNTMLNLWYHLHLC